MNRQYQLPGFDAELSRMEKELGIERAASVPERKGWIEAARAVGRFLGQKNGTVNMDDVARYFAKRNIDLYYKIGNAAGKVFSAKDFYPIICECCHQQLTIESERVRSHSNLVRIWGVKS